MRRTNKLNVVVAVVVVSFLWSAASFAVEVQLTNPVIIDSAAAFPGYEVPNALDGNTLTDYASNGQGVNTFITFDFGAPVTITRYVYTDRTSSGGANGSGAGGNGDNVSLYRYHHSFNDANFTDFSDLFFAGLASGSAPSFTDSVSIPVGITTRYLRWNVLTTAGANPGAAEFQFFTFDQPVNQIPNPVIANNAPAFPGYDAALALDGNPLTDYASLGQGNNTFIDFDFGAPTLINRVDITDRVTSGGPNGAFAGGSGDNVAFYDLIFSDDAIFGNADDREYDGTSVGFANTTSLFVNGDLGDTARFVRWQVLQANGANIGAAEFRFFAAQVIPEPASLALLAVAGLALLSRRRAA